MPPPYLWMGAAVLGLVAAVALALTDFRQRQQNNNHRSHIRICSICGQRISQNPYVSACGHQFHRNCYADKLLDHRDRGGGSNMSCPSCGYSSRNTESPSGRMRRQSTLRRNSDSTSNSSRNDNGSSNETRRCCYCSRNLTELVEKVDKLDCGHNAHHDCRIHRQEVTRISTRMTTNLTFLRVFSFILYFGRIHVASNNDYDIQKLTTVYSWKSLNFAYPSAAARQQAIDNGEFDEGNIIPLDVDVVYGLNGVPKILITIPRFQKGVPVALGVVTDQLSANGEPIIKPYPNWEWNRLGDCNHFTSIYRMAVDDCDRIWLLDSGSVLGKQVCPPQLLVFNSRTDQLVLRYTFPSNQLKQTSLFINLIVDILSKQNQCLNTFVYIVDVNGFQLLVYDHKQKKSWNIQHNTFNRNAIYANITINGLSFGIPDGIFGVALSPPQTNGDRTLYFHSFTSLNERWIPTSVIRNSTIFINNTSPPPGSVHTFSLTRTSQSAIEAMSKGGILFYGLVEQTSLGCWNSITHPNFGGNNVGTLATSSTLLDFISGMKIRQYKNRPEELWMMTVPFAEYRNGLINPNVTNYRIIANYVDDLIQGSKCDWPPLQKGRVEPRKNKKYHL